MLVFWAAPLLCGHLEMDRVFLPVSFTLPSLLPFSLHHLFLGFTCSPKPNPFPPLVIGKLTVLGSLALRSSWDSNGQLPGGANDL